jgi:uncharacterized protein (DUF3084 family)
MSKSQLLQVLDDLIEKQTFSAAAADGIAALRKQAEDAETKATAALTANAELQKAKAKVEQSNAELQNKINDWNMLADNIYMREKKITELEKQAAVSSALSDAYIRMFDKVFANRQFREKSIDSHSESGYANNQSTSKSVTHSITREGEES